MKKIIKRQIPDQYYIGLKAYGHIVPRSEKDGIPIQFKVGEDYLITSPSHKEELLVRCTQDCPYSISLKN